MSAPLKRFWQTVSLRQQPAGWTIALDDKELKSPAGKNYALPQRLAEQVMAEWQTVERDIKPAVMPATQIAATATDHYPEKRAETIQEIVNYCDTELLCYRASEPAALRERQEIQWQPALTWTARQYAVMLRVTEGIQPITQPSPFAHAIAADLHQLTDLQLVAVHSLVTGLGSVVLGMALRHKFLGFDKAWQLAELDALFQAERWGVDAEAKQAADKKCASLQAAYDVLMMVV